MNPRCPKHVDPEDFENDMEQYGGIPQYDRHGVYVGSVFGPFDNTLHQDHDESE